MNKRFHFPRLLILTNIIFLFAHPIFAQLDSIFDQNVWRTFIVHLPSGYTASNQYPLVFDFHGLNSNAAQQQAYSQLDAFADAQGFIAIYPNGLNNQWDVAGNTDVDFVSHLIDTLKNEYSCNACLFSTGMSDGGFMTYKLACALPQPLTAIAVVSGNMAITLQSNCPQANGLPVMHFHGTDDVIVNYNGVWPIIPPVDTTILWWVNKNDCSPTPVFTALPNINTTDSCTVEEYYYGGGINNSEVTFYKIINGGHTWPGAIPFPPLGKTDLDINASELIGEFFHQFCSALPVSEIKNSVPFSIYPNPAVNLFTAELPAPTFEIEILDVTGHRLCTVHSNETKTQIDCSHFPSGIYFVNISNEKDFFHQTLVVSH